MIHSRKHKRRRQILDPNEMTFCLGPYDIRSPPRIVTSGLRVERGEGGVGPAGDCNAIVSNCGPPVAFSALIPIEMNAK